MPRTSRCAVAVALTALLLTACGSDPPPAAAPDPVADLRAPDPPRSPSPAAPPGGLPVELRLSIPVGEAPDGTTLEVVVRSVEVSGRRLVTIDTPAGRVDQHVVTDDEHWWWIPPMAREAVGEVRWIHIDVREVEAVDGQLPDVVTDARLPLPAPGQLRPGTTVAGYEVVDVQRVGPDEDDLTLAGIDGPVRLRRRVLPAGTEVELPPDAVELADLPAAVHPELVPR